jgi:hypothetical protein
VQAAINTANQRSLLRSADDDDRTIGRMTVITAKLKVPTATSWKKPLLAYSAKVRPVRLRT